MNKTLIINAFEKAGGEITKIEGKNDPSIVEKASLLSDKINDLTGAIIGEKRLRQYYKEALDVKNKDEDISIFQREVIDGLCKYLGYDSYKSFADSLSNSIGFIKRIKKYRVVLLSVLLGVIIMVTLSSLYFTDQQKWMVWREDHYEEVAFDSKLLADGKLKLYKEERIENFRKVVGDCNTIYFNTDGEVKIWYGKNHQGKLECFTDVGLHPETGKTLKPISKYMIEKYLCDSYSF